MPFVETDSGISLHYEEHGSGRPVVFIHGWCMSGVAWRFQEPLAERFRLLCPDLRGHGYSPLPASGFTLAELGGDLGDFFSHFDLQDAILVGWSLGSMVALQAFSALRERLAALVLVGANPRFTADNGYPHGLPAQEVRGMELRVRRDCRNTLHEFFRGMFVAGELSREMENRLAHEIVMLGKPPAHEVAHAGLKILATADLRRVLPEIDLPTLIVHGTGDIICPSSVAGYLAGMISGSRLELLDGMGHAPFLSHPERFNELLLDFESSLTQHRDKSNKTVSRDDATNAT